jgi:hypothetical protein
LTQDGLRFITSRKKFFIPVKVLSCKFRGKFLFHLKLAAKKNEIKFYNDCKYLEQDMNFDNLLCGLYQKDWVVYCKKPFKSPWHVISYLGRYTHRVAIANSRIIDFDGHSVKFKWKDYKDHNRVKLMTLKVTEFVRRFLLHVLPSGFTRIRHYGLLASRNIGIKLAMCIKLSSVKVVSPSLVKHVITCPICGGVMAFSGLINRSAAVP